MKDSRRFTKLFMLATIAVGALACAYAAAQLNLVALDLRFVVLATCTLGFGSRLGVRIPRSTSDVTVSDTFIFITLLLYGWQPAVLLAAAEGFLTCTRRSKRPITFLFNSSVMAVSIFLAAHALENFYGDLTALRFDSYSAQYIVALYGLALVYYAANSGLVAAGEAFRDGKAVWQTWRERYLWTSLTCFASAAAAGIISRLIDAVGFYAAIAVLPIIAIIFLSYRTYQRSIEASVERAELAQNHVEELSRYIAEQERIREQFMQVEKMSALGELASGVAHNFNNTLAAILARAELLLTQTSDPKMRRGLEIIVKSAGDGAKTVRSIQDFARQRRDHDFHPLPVDELLSDASEITRPRWKDAAEAANIHIELTLRNNSRALVRGDAGELRDVLINMVFNAVDAMPNGGKLRLEAEESGDWVIISIADTGMGMSAEVAAKVFDPFFTTKGVSGMGLGLATSYGVVSRHGGSIIVESEIGRGTTFRIRLPAAGRVGGGPEAEATIEIPRRIKMAKILVVDDEEPVRQLLCEILEDAGCETVGAKGGLEALALFDSEHFDAVFTDIGMPGMSGWELARLLCERDPEIPLAVITGWGETISSSQKEAACVDWHLSKPFSLAEIIQLGQEIDERCKTFKGRGGNAPVREPVLV